MTTEDLKAAIELDGEYVCPHCGAEVRPYWKSCWMCSQPLAPNDAVPSGSHRSGFGPSATRPDENSLLGGIVLGITALLLLFMMAGIAANDGPESVIGFLLFLTPAFVITLTKTLRRRDTENPMSLLKITTTFLFWSIGSVLLLIGLVIALVAALFVVCLVEGPPNFH